MIEEFRLLAEEARLLRLRETASCATCARCMEFPQGSVCTLHGAAGWFATEPRGFCWKWRERKSDGDEA